MPTLVPRKATSTTPTVLFGQDGEPVTLTARQAFVHVIGSPTSSGSPTGRSLRPACRRTAAAERPAGNLVGSVGAASGQADNAADRPRAGTLLGRFE
jgi:hypothetical protein